MSATRPEYHTFDLPSGTRLTVRQSLIPTANGPNDAGPGDWLQLDCELCGACIGQYFVSAADWPQLGRKFPQDTGAEQFAALERHVAAHSAETTSAQPTEEA